MTLPVLAVDLGAGSARVCLVDLDASPPTLEVLHRAVHEPARSADGVLRWDWRHLVSAVERGLRLGLSRGPIASIGVDTWGVDYGLLDASGSLVAPPVSYRDHRTDGWREVVETVGEERLYEATGVQLQPLNTIFQLAAHDRAELGRAAHVVLLPELLVHHLTGAITGEVTSAATTALVDLATGTWSDELCAAIDLDPTLLPPIAPATTAVGMWEGVPVHLVGGHDTASATVALAGSPATGAAHVSTGTWFLVGVERDEADVSAAARSANVSNEAGALGGRRLLKNVPGFWLVEECRRSWGDPPVDELLAAAERAGSVPVADAFDPALLHPDDMEAALRAAAGLPASAGRAEVVRCALDSVAAACALVVDELAALQGRPVPELHVLGGAVRSPLVLCLLDAACGVPVRPGPVEATALGNALVQGVALGRFADLADARAALGLTSPRRRAPQ